MTIILKPACIDIDILSNKKEISIYISFHEFTVRQFKHLDTCIHIQVQRAQDAIALKVWKPLSA